MELQHIKKRIFEIIEKSESSEDKPGRAFDFFIITLIILNIIAVIIASYNEIFIKFESSFYIIEIVSVIIFSIEYLLRFWTARLKFPDKRHPYLAFFFSFMAMIDLLAVMPFYIPFLLPIDLRFLRILRLLRLLRIFKLNRYNESMNMIGRVLVKERHILLTTFFITFVLLLLASSLMYYIENEAQPDKFPNIIASFWWAVATLTTVGYGDVIPVTPIGKLLSGTIALLGIGLVALPTAVISSGFINEINKKKRKNKCPHCGMEIDI